MVLKRLWYVYDEAKFIAYNNIGISFAPKLYGIRSIIKIVT